MNRPHQFPAQGDAQWHAGEVAMQKTAGSDELLAPHAPSIFQPSLSEQMQNFFKRLPFILVGFVDDEMRPWGTLLAGQPGFACSLDSSSLQVNCIVPDGDPLAGSLRRGAPIGVLGIELPTRRRNRVNGVLSNCDAAGFSIQVKQAYGNCPKYIQQRVYKAMNNPPLHVTTQDFTNLDDAEARKLIAATDTLFVATYAPGPEGLLAMDISHRGGRAGFVRVDADGTLTIPDFSGNKYFNTLGNILVTGRAGLLIPSFDNGDLLLLTGDASVGLDQDSGAEAAQFPGAERLWRIRPLRGYWLRAALPVDFHLQDWPQSTLDTGTWPASSTDE